MTKPPKRPRDANQLAKFIADLATGEAPPTGGPAPLTPQERGSLGGKKGGEARAKKLTPEQRSESARKAAASRWAR